MARCAMSRSVLLMLVCLTPAIVVSQSLRGVPAPTAASTCDELAATQLHAGPDHVTLSNGFVSVTFDLLTGAISALSGDFSGGGNFVTNLAAPTTAHGGPGGLALEVEFADLSSTSSSGFTRTAPLAYTVLANTSSAAAFSVKVSSSATNPVAEAVYEFGVSQASRQLELNITAQTFRAASVIAVHSAVYFNLPSTTVFYTDGVTQAMNQAQPLYASTTPFLRMYAVGNSGAVELVGPEVPAQSVAVNGIWDGRRSGMQFVHVGNVPGENRWMDGWEGSAAVDVAAGTKFSVVRLLLSPNDRPFPASGVPACGTDTAMIDDDLDSVMRAVYASTAGAFISHSTAPWTHITPCIGVPGRCYAGLSNFFDPDSFLSITAMTYAADPYLFEQTRGLLETNEQFICPQDTPGVCSGGQMPHHFLPYCPNGQDGCRCINKIGCVTYYAISGATQTGPNIFWTLASLRYAATSGNYTWLKDHLPNLRHAMSFLTNLYDPTYHLLSVPGSLFIDTFKRYNLTTDSNGAMVYLLNQFADAEDFVGNSTGAEDMRAMASTIAAAMNKYLWAPSNDHYVSYAILPVAPATNLTQRDFVDYDSNLLAIMAGVPTSRDQSLRILAKLDDFDCAHRRATWVSQIPYNTSNCWSGNTGDSMVAMGRIGWLDGRSRLRVGGAAAAAVAKDLILTPLQQDLLRNTWMYERYQCGAKPTHNPYYIEYPEVVTMLLAEVKYGLDIGFDHLTVSPLLAESPFVWSVGTFALSHATDCFTAAVHMTGTRTFNVSGVTPGAWMISTVARSPVAAGVTGACAGTVLPMPRGLLPPRTDLRSVGAQAAGAGLGTTTVTVGSNGVLSFTAATAPSVTVVASLQAPAAGWQFVPHDVQQAQF